VNALGKHFTIFAKFRNSVIILTRLDKITIGITDDTETFAESTNFGSKKKMQQLIYRFYFIERHSSVI
jgi:hypothetical protein